MKGGTLDVRSDLFSFGVILAEMITGRHPFRQPSMAETLSAVLREPPNLSGDILQGPMDLVRRLLAKTPEDRYESAADVRADLARLALSFAAVATAPIRHGASAGRKELAWSASALGLVLVGYLIVTSGLLRPTSRAPGGAPGIRSIAVLPLDNYSGDPNQDYFAEGMTDELTANLDHQPASRHLARIGDAVQRQGSAADA